MTIEYNFDGALAAVEFAKEKSAAAFSKNSILYAKCLHSEGRTFYQMGRYPDAESSFLGAMSIKEKISGRENEDFATYLNGLGAVYHEMGGTLRRESLYIEAIKARAKVLGKENSYYANTVNNLAICTCIRRNMLRPDRFL
ncbi:MAG: tetratricopeptide repeat protein [Lewinellaceae bacterium]|nr:tetratricopeptide repeat protein [Lewinellaceae bacterium]